MTESTRLAVIFFLNQPNGHIISQDDIERIESLIRFSGSVLLTRIGYAGDDPENRFMFEFILSESPAVIPEYSKKLWMNFKDYFGFYPYGYITVITSSFTFSDSVHEDAIIEMGKKMMENHNTRG